MPYGSTHTTTRQHRVVRGIVFGQPQSTEAGPATLSRQAAEDDGFARPPISVIHTRPYMDSAARDMDVTYDSGYNTSPVRNQHMGRHISAGELHPYTPQPPLPVHSTVRRNLSMPVMPGGMGMPGHQGGADPRYHMPPASHDHMRGQAPPGFHKPDEWSPLMGSGASQPSPARASWDDTAPRLVGPRRGHGGMKGVFKMSMRMYDTMGCYELKAEERVFLLLASLLLNFVFLIMLFLRI